VLLRLGDTYVKKGDKAAATEAYLRVAALYTEQGFFQKGIAVYKQILKLDPRLVDVNYKLADLYKQLGLLSDAMQQYELASTFLHREGRAQEALEALRRMVDLEPENVASRIKLAEAYSKDGQVAEAVVEFTQAADTLRQMNRTDDFIKVAERLVFHEPDNRAVQRELAELYIRRSDPKRALPKLQQCFKADPRDADTLGLLAQTFQQLGQLSKTISVLKELARIHVENGKLAERDATFRQILQLAPGDAEALGALSGSAVSEPPARVAIPIANQSTTRLASGSPPATTRLASGSPPATTRLASGSPPASGPAREGSRPSAHSAPLPPPEDSDPAMAIVEMEVSGPLMEDDTLDEPTGVRASSQDDGSASLLDVEVEPSEEEVGEETSRILSETDVYIKYGLYDKALAHVRRVFEHEPDSLEAREKLKEIYLQVGDYHEAVNELCAAARQVAPTRPEEAIRYLREAVALEPDHEPAANLLRRLLAQAPAAAAEDAWRGPTEGLPRRPDDEVITDEHDALQDLEVEVDAGGSHRPEAYGAEEVEAFAEAGDEGGGLGEDVEIIDDSVAPPETLFEFEEHDDYAPGRAARPPEEEAPSVEILEAMTPLVGRPAFLEGDLGTEETTPVSESGFLEEAIAQVVDDVRHAAIASSRADYPRAASDEPTLAFDDLAPTPPALGASPVNDDELLAMTAAPRVATPVVAPPAPPPAAEARPPAAAPAPRPPPVAPPAAAGEGSLEDELDEVDFFVHQALYAQAREMVGEILARYPNHPLVQAKLREVDDAEGVTAPAPMVEPPPATPRPSPVPPPPVSVSPPPPASAAATITSSLGAERSPQRMVQQPVDVKDFDTHYDLGIAYKEMGLYNDAIREFELIAQAPGKEVLCHTMMGLCFSDKGMQSEAISHFKKGLYVEGITERETITLYYELGAAYEKLSDPREALYYYEKVIKRDVTFRDVEKRVAALRDQVANPALQAGGNGGTGPPVERDAELDAAFEGLIAAPGPGGPTRN
jgi:tetratricopeptide (TPR) repeat protein